MNMRSMLGSKPKTDEEYQAEIDRMIPEIEAMLKLSGERIERARRVGRENNRILDALEQRYLCGKE